MAKLKTKAWILAGIAVVAIGILGLIGPKIVELDAYLDRQIEGLRARR